MPKFRLRLQDFTSEWSYKILALIITIVLWVFIMGRDDVIESKSIDIMVSLPDNYVLSRLEPKKVKISIRGNPKIARRYFEQKKSLVYEVYNTSHAVLRIPIRPDKLDLPFGLEVVEISPKFFDIRMQPMSDKVDSPNMQPNGKQEEAL